VSAVALTIDLETKRKGGAVQCRVAAGKILLGFRIREELPDRRADGAIVTAWKTQTANTENAKGGAQGGGESHDMVKRGVKTVVRGALKTRMRDQNRSKKSLDGPSRISSVHDLDRDDREEL